MTFLILRLTAMFRKLQSADRIANVEGTAFHYGALAFALIAVAGAVASLLTLDEPVTVMVGFGIGVLGGLLLLAHGLFVLARGAGWMPGRTGTRYVKGLAARVIALFYVVAGVTCLSVAYVFLASQCTDASSWCVITKWNTVQYVSTDDISITTPFVNQIIASPFTLSGEAVGNWYFEATLPVKLLDADGNVLVQTYVTAQDEWMTTDFVRFEGLLEFAAPENGDKGTVVFMKDNPSGLPENDD